MAHSIHPVAIIGIGCVYPRATNVDAFRRLLADGEPAFGPFPANRFWRLPDSMSERLNGLPGSYFGDLDIDLRAFRIPRVYKRAVSTMTLLLMQAARDCIADAGYGADGNGLPVDTTDIIAGVCFGFDSTLTNALKIHGLEWLENLAPAAVDAGREALRAHFGCSSHDRVGEMSSSIAARIGAMYGCHGRIMAVENGDATGYAAIRTAMLSLAERQSDTVLVATGQRMESSLVPLALQAKGFSDVGGTAAIPLGEGATALLLKRLDDARRDGDHVHAVIAGLAARRADTSELRYTSDARLMRDVAQDACAMAGLEANAVVSVECVLPGMASAAADIAATFPERLQTSATTVLGHSFANAGAAAVAATALAFDTSERTGPVAVVGISITGLTWTLLLHSSCGLSTDDRLPAAPATPEPIAVVGIGGCFGASISWTAFQDALSAGSDDIRRISEEALPRATAFDKANASVLTSYAEQGGELSCGWEFGYFDAKRLRLFPKRVAALDTAQKLALAVAAEALDDFGLDTRHVALGRAMVIVASPLCLGRERDCSNRLHALELAAVLAPYRDRSAAASHAAAEIGPLTLDGMLAGNIAALISGCFRLKAEGMVLEAACASSLAAVHTAMQALRCGYADWVLAGGIEMPVNMRDLILCSTQRMLSDDKIAPFAVDADGFSPGDGAGLFVLRRLTDAQRDGDTIHGCLIGAGASSDAASMTAPAQKGQIMAMRRAFADARVHPDSVGYVEAHGTGTRIGDGIEIAALGDVYGESPRRVPLLIGSVKSNIGHAFAAAGAASLMKTLLALNSETVPRTLLRRELNPDLALAAIPATITAVPSPWPAADGPRRAAVNSMGTGGINFHLLVEAAHHCPLNTEEQNNANHRSQDPPA